MKKCLHAALVFSSALLLVSCQGPSNVTLPGRLPDGRVRLPNGWVLSPAGTSVEVGELPLNMVLTPNESYVVVTNNGTRDQSLSVIETDTWKVVQTLPMRKAWLGLRFLQGGSRLLVSGGNDNRVDILTFASGRLALADSIILADPWPKEKMWVGGLDVDERSGRMYVAGTWNDALYVVDLASRAIIQTIQLPAKPYTCVVSGRHARVFVSLWGGSSVACLDAATLTVKRLIPVGGHPCDMIASPDEKRLFVSNANQNTVSVIDMEKEKVIETISTALFPDAPSGSTPNAVALSPDDRLLYVANADNNYLAVFDISNVRESRSLGFIPVGWYPTSVRVLHKTGQILVANGKGLSSMPNPEGPNPERRGTHEQYIGSLFRGTVSKIDPPDLSALERYTAAVYANSPCADVRKNASPSGEPNPIPRQPADTSPVKHIFYVIKENRTYDQVFGDLEQGNGDPSLCLFPDSVTPNHHALAREFVLLDNFYCDAEVSADGHNWSMAAYATDYVEKTWPTHYGGRGGAYVFEGGTPIVYPSAGYIWDNCNRHGVTYRSYGEFARNGTTIKDSSKAMIPSLEGHVAPFYWGWNLDYSDVDRVRDWMREFDEFDRNGGLPQFQIIKLPNDHTSGTSAGRPTPRAYVAQNDLALGMVVERISTSRYWKESAIFVIEDDAQNGPDHVDAHRTVALVVSPYAKRRFVDSELYSTSSMIRTMELILGLPPLSQFDAAATPMYNAFSMEPDFSMYRCRPASVDLDQRNPAGAYGQARSGELDFSREDAIPDVEFSEIIWKSIRGPASAMPAPVRSAFVMVPGEDDD